jgi:hypothetical protein
MRDRTRVQSLTPKTTPENPPVPRECPWYERPDPTVLPPKPARYRNANRNEAVTGEVA